MTDRLDSSRRRALAQLSAGSLATLAPWALQRRWRRPSRSPSASSTSARATTTATTRRRPQAAAELKKMPGVKVVEEENVPETAAVQKTMAGMIEQDGAKLLFPTSFGYFDPHMLAVAPKYPDVRFSHCGGLWTEGKHPKNAGSYFGYIDECQYLNGVVAGHMTQEQQARLRRRQADPAGAAQHQRLHAGRALGRPEDHDAA